MSLRAFDVLDRFLGSLRALPHIKFAFRSAFIFRVLFQILIKSQRYCALFDQLGLLLSDGCHVGLHFDGMHYGLAWLCESLRQIGLVLRVLLVGCALLALPETAASTLNGGLL